MEKVAIIGGGAAGFFTAINLAERRPDLSICIYEGSQKFLSKVLVSGGGRCNLSNELKDPQQLAQHYPRGHEVLAEVFKKFGSVETQRWFQDRGLPLKTEADGRVFPLSDSSQSIYDLFMKLCVDLDIELRTQHRLKAINPQGNAWELSFKHGVEQVDQLVICSGGNPAIWKMLSSMGLECEQAVPSLFTFKAAKNEFTELSGISVPNVTLQFKGSDVQNGPILITHQGFSGPAVLKLSAWEAYELNRLEYNFDLIVNWLPNYSHTELLELLLHEAKQDPKQRVYNYHFHELPKRLYRLLCARAGLKEFTNGAEMGKKRALELLKTLQKCQIQIQGKQTFKEEFVTAGGLSLSELDLETFRSKKYPSLYLAGEVLNIDAITGGFNFQAAWSAAYLISQAI